MNSFDMLIYCVTVCYSQLWANTAFSIVVLRYSGQPPAVLWAAAVLLPVLILSPDALSLVIDNRWATRHSDTLFINSFTFNWKTLRLYRSPSIDWRTSTCSLIRFLVSCFIFYVEIPTVTHVFYVDQWQSLTYRHGNNEYLPIKRKL